MKAATGELNLTVITLIAIAAVIGFFITIMWPQIQNSINSQWNQINTQDGTNGGAFNVDGNNNANGNN